MDRFENMGVQMAHEVATKTADVAGDGTTTATVFAHAIFREGLKNVTGGANPMEIKRGIDAAVEAVSPYFVTDPQTMETILEDAYILIHAARRSTRRPTTARSSGSGSPSWPVVWPSSTKKSLSSPLGDEYDWGEDEKVSM